jgi:single-strand DNA-binding protein
MAGVNKVILIGNLGSDPEIRHLPSGSVVANFNIATTETYTNKEGQKVKQTEWHKIELWEGLAKIAEQFLKKGSQVYIEGKIKTETWQDSDGNTKSTVRIRGNSMTLLGSRGGDSPEFPKNAQSADNNKTGPSIDLTEDMDDLPF